MMPWTGAEFKSRHWHDATDVQARKAASIANGILRSGGEEGTAIATGIKKARELASLQRLIKMVHAEVATEKWWHEMTLDERQAYVQAHPNSKYSQLAQTSTHSASAQSHTDAMKHHEQLEQQHKKAAMVFRNRGITPLYYKHTDAANLHHRAKLDHTTAYALHDSMAKSNSAVQEKLASEASRLSRRATASSDAAHQLSALLNGGETHGHDQ